MTGIALSRLHFPVQSLGPGRRVGVWVQGCSIRCPGCISVDTWAPGNDKTDVESVLRAIAQWAREADGLTISGGEPFEQVEALVALVQGWRRLSEADVLIFSGYEFDQIRPCLESNPGVADGVITGPYQTHVPQTLALRGSDNQELHILTDRGARLAAYERLAGPEDRRLDVMFDQDGGIWFAGIPARNDFQKLRRALKAEGHHVVMSDQVSEFDL